jgi:uncharacterized protein (TIGR02246 family)
MIARRLPFLLAAALAMAGLGLAAGSSLGQEPKPAPTAAEPERPEDVKAVQALGQAFVKAYNQGDAQAIAALFTEEAEVASDEQELEVRGRKAIAEHFAKAFKEGPGAKLEIQSESVRFLGPDLAREVGYSRVTPAAGKGAPETGRYTALLVKHGGRWLHASVVESPDRMPTPHERLAELEWMLGDWVDENDEGVVHTTCKWSDDGNFLLREFALKFAGRPMLSGSQRIGWDPLAGQFKSWVFDPDGGHSEGHWSREGEDQWIIHARGVLPDGRPVASTQVLTRVGKTGARWKSVNRTVGGEALPDIAEVVLVRTPPKAKAR